MFSEYTNADRNIPQGGQIYWLFFKCTKHITNVLSSLQIYKPFYKYMNSFSKYTMNFFSHFIKPAQLQHN